MTTLSSSGSYPTAVWETVGITALIGSEFEFLREACHRRAEEVAGLEDKNETVYWWTYWWWFERFEVALDFCTAQHC